MRVERLDGNPIVVPGDRIGENINGPSVIRVPGWIEDPLGEYYCYFAHHSGSFIRLAYADEMGGPWEIYDPGVLDVGDTPFAVAAGEDGTPHIASPDVHVDHDRERLRMYYHGAPADYEDASGVASQCTRLATSRSGLDFRSGEAVLGRFYFRVFEHGGSHYALAKENRGPGQGESGQWVYRSPDGLGEFERGPLLLRDGSRHTAVRVRGSTLDLFYSRIGDAPERILHTTVDLKAPWTEWEAGEPETVLAPERDWEGADRPVEPSSAGGVHEPVCQLRDPAVFEDGEETYLLYSVAGERGLAVARIVE
ncbi:MAG: hypothetical protein ABEH66_01855 [Halobacteriales archaeon]